MVYLRNISVNEVLRRNVNTKLLKDMFSNLNCNRVILFNILITLFKLILIHPFITYGSGVNNIPYGSESYCYLSEGKNPKIDQQKMLAFRTYHN